MKKLVGIADACKEGMVSVGINYPNAVMRTGHIPVLLPQTDDMSLIREMLEKVDVLLLSGGGADVDPVRYGAEKSPYVTEISQERDAFEFRLLEVAAEMRKPVFGICRGIQVINVFFGGTLYQDLPTEYSDQSICHQRPDKEWEPVHDIKILAGSKLSAFLGGMTETQVNSTHHQACKEVAPGFIVSATAPDGVVEAVESETLPIVAVQFHPERLLDLQSKLKSFYCARLFSCTERTRRNSL